MQKAREGWACSPSHTKQGKGRDRSQAEYGCQDLLSLALLIPLLLGSPLLYCPYFMPPALTPRKKVL